MRPRILATGLALAGALAVGACSVVGGQAAPEPAYAVVRADAPFEIRDYGELVVVRTAMDDGTSGAFGRLFDYISGANAGSRKIAMTAPVLQSGQGEKIAMTAPVLQTDGGARDMIFVLPEAFTADTAPVPTDPAVQLDVIAPRRVAVIGFSGRLNDQAVAENRATLLAWMQAQQLEPTGTAESAGYNPPWTLPQLRRNEVLIPISPDAGG